jgi:DNA-binding NtrC family response regulator
VLLSPARPLLPWNWVGEIMAEELSRVSALVVDPEGTAADKIDKVLTSHGWEVQVCPQTGEALERAEQVYFDLVFMADRIQDGSCDELLYNLTDMFPDTLCVVMAAKPQIGQAVNFLRAGAFDYIPNPKTPKAVEEVLSTAVEFRRLQAGNNGGSSPAGSQTYDVANIVGKSRPMQEVFRLIHKVAGSDATALILGESGTGKELVARAIHANSVRSAAPMVPVNCGAIPGELLESELFGHEKGAFTGAIKTRLGRFELAQGGTVFLDEIGDMASLLQVKLLRVLQDRQFERVGGGRTISADLRIIAATHQDLDKLVKKGKFREDLYYRLNVVPIPVPPLRERRSDIPLLCDFFLKRLSLKQQAEPKELAPDVKDVLLRYDWPGNVRELENILERMVILSDGEVITLADLPPHLASGAPALAEIPPGGLLHTVEVPDDGIDFNQKVDEFERSLISQALDKTGWVKNQAAALLNLNRTTLVEKIKKKGLTPPAKA